MAIRQFAHWQLIPYEWNPPALPLYTCPQAPYYALPWWFYENRGAVYLNGTRSRGTIWFGMPSSLVTSCHRFESQLLGHPKASGEPYLPTNHGWLSFKGWRFNFYAKRLLEALISILRQQCWPLCHHIGPDPQSLKTFLKLCFVKMITKCETETFMKFLKF